MHIVMTGKGKQGLKVTLHHTFDTCVSKHNPFMHAVESYGTVVVMAKDIKAGDCLHTADGKRSVRSAAPAIVQEGDVTYSIKLADKISTVAIGGVFTHAMGHLRNKHRTPSSFEEQEKKYKKVNKKHNRNFGPFGKFSANSGYSPIPPRFLSSLANSHNQIYHHTNNRAVFPTFRVRVRHDAAR